MTDQNYPVANYDAQMAEAAAQYAGREKSPSARFFSTNSGVLTFDETPMPGNQLAAVVLHSVFENTYYPSRFNPNQIESPRCYAIGEDEDELGPHPDMQKYPEHMQPQAAYCQECPMAEWGSSQFGQGKACQQRRRLALLPAGYYAPSAQGMEAMLYDTPEEYAGSEMAFLKLPVTSVSGWAKYVKMLAREYQRPPYGVITRIFLQPDPKSQFKVHFEVIDVLPNHLIAEIMKRHEEARDNIITTYSPPDDPQQSQAAHNAAARLR